MWFEMFGSGRQHFKQFTVVFALSGSNVGEGGKNIAWLSSKGKGIGDRYCWSKVEMASVFSI